MHTDIAIPTAAYTAMSFNLLAFSGENDPTAQRIANVKNVILTKMPDTFGVQECQSHTSANHGTGWYEILTQDPQITQYYGFVGEVNDDGFQNMYNLVFYRKDKFTLVETWTKWLTETPTVHGSMLTDLGQNAENDMPRTVTYALLRDQTTGKTFAHFNTHLSNWSNALLRELEILKSFTDVCTVPYIITGDFNIGRVAVQYSWGACYEYMRTHWKDACKHAFVSTEEWTTGSNIIDYFMLSDSIYANTYEVVSSVGGTEYSIDRSDPSAANFLSDHYPIFLNYFIE